MRRLVGTVALAANGCVTTALPPATASGFRLEDDERSLWRQAEEAESNSRAASSTRMPIWGISERCRPAARAAEALAAIPSASAWCATRT